MDYDNELLAHFEAKNESSHHYAAFRWTKKIIESCHNSYHIQCSKTLIDLFRASFNNEHLADELTAILDRRKIMILIP